MIIVVLVAAHSNGSAAIESARYALGEVDPSRAAPRVCFFCAHSDNEPAPAPGVGTSRVSSQARNGTA